MTTITSQQFNRDSGRAKRAAADGTVIVTDRGRPAHVLMTFEDYRRLTGGPTIGERIGMQPTNTVLDEAELDPPRAVLGFRPADLD